MSKYTFRPIADAGRIYSTRLLAAAYARHVQVRETNLKQLVQGEKQFRVPLWQRQYTWRAPDHQLLWRDILEQYSQVMNSSTASQSGHFLGSVVLSPLPSAASEQLASYLIVDGQQRLTTLMLILAAIRDVAASTDTKVIERYNELYLINKFQSGDAYFRLVPTQADRPSYWAFEVNRDGVTAR